MERGIFAGSLAPVQGEGLSSDAWNMENIPGPNPFFALAGGSGSGSWATLGVALLDSGATESPLWRALGKVEY